MKDYERMKGFEQAYNDAIEITFESQVVKDLTEKIEELRSEITDQSLRIIELEKRKWFNL